jgi:hypothetical protein
MCGIDLRRSRSTGWIRIEGGHRNFEGEGVVEVRNPNLEIRKKFEIRISKKRIHDINQFVARPRGRLQLIFTFNTSGRSFEGSARRPL